METQSFIPTKSDRNAISRERTRQLQQLFSHMLLMTINHAVSHLNVVALHQPEQLADEFRKCLRLFEGTKLIIDLLSEGRRGFSDGVDLDYFFFDERDLFYAVSSVTRDKLRSKGIYFDSFTETD